MPLKPTLLNSDQSILNLGKWKEETPLVIAHRGASHCAPENTMRSFHEALSLGADAIELDTQLSADGEVMVFHDASLERATNGTGALLDYSAQNLRNLDAGSHFDAEFAGEKIPFLHEVISTFGRSMKINVELKNFAQPWNVLPDRVVSIIREFKVEDRVLLSSFNPWALIRAKRRFPEIPVGLLVASDEPRWIRILLQGLLRYDAFHPHHDLLNPEVVRTHHLRSRIVNAWTLNEVDRMLELCEWGVDGLITDHPGLARETLENAGFRGKEKAI